MLTAYDGPRAITWIGEGKVLATRRPPHRRHAGDRSQERSGPNVPHRDLHVTKGHSLFIDEVLIPVEFLINHRADPVG